MQDPLEWVERARLRWPLNLYKATRRRRSLDDCVHDVFRTGVDFRLSASFKNLRLILSSNLSDRIENTI